MLRFFICPFITLRHQTLGWDSQKKTSGVCQSGTVYGQMLFLMPNQWFKIIKGALVSISNLHTTVHIYSQKRYHTRQIILIITRSRYKKNLGKKTIRFAGNLSLSSITYNVHPQLRIPWQYYNIQARV